MTFAIVSETVGTIVIQENKQSLPATTDRQLQCKFNGYYIWEIDRYGTVVQCGCVYVSKV